LTKLLSFRVLVPARLPPRFLLLPAVNVNSPIERVDLKYDGGEDHLVFVQTAREPVMESPPTSSKLIRQLPVTISDEQVTSLWVRQTYGWKLSNVQYLLSFNWLHQLSWDSPEREPIQVTDEMTTEGLTVVESLIAQAQSATSV
jgi:hypothetical protein